MYSSRFGMYSSRFGMYSTRFGTDPADFDRYSTDGDFGMYLTDSEIGMYSSDGETTCPGAEDPPIATTTAASSSTGADGVDNMTTTPPTVASPSMTTTTTTTTTTAPTPEAAPAAFQAYTEAVAVYERRAPAPSVRLVPVRFLVLQTTSRPGGPPASATHLRYLAVAGVQPVARAQLLAVLQGLLDAILPPSSPPPSTSPPSSSSAGAGAAAVVAGVGDPPRRRRLALADVTLHGADVGPGDTTPRGLADFADDGLAWELRAMAEERERAMAAAPHRRAGAGVGDACGIDVVVDDTV